MARILNEIYKDKLKPGKAKVLIYGTNVLASIIKDGDFEKRLDNLEAQVKERDNGQY